MTEKTDNSSRPASFYIVTTSGAYEDCGFKNDNLTAPDGANLVGFMKCKFHEPTREFRRLDAAYWQRWVLVGTQIIWSDSSDGSYTSQFWAESTETDGPLQAESGMLQVPRRLTACLLRSRPFHPRESVRVVVLNLGTAVKSFDSDQAWYGRSLAWFRWLSIINYERCFFPVFLATLPARYYLWKYFELASIRFYWNISGSWAPSALACVQSRNQT